MNPVYVSRAASLLHSIITLYFNMPLMTVLAKDTDNTGLEWPCTSRSSIQWIRHPTDCSRYFICHFGQPVLMPGCPFEQVWGTEARNCVPRNSRWDDCSGSLSPNSTNSTRGDVVTGDKEVRYHHPVSGSPVPLPLPAPVQTIVVQKISSKKTNLQTTQGLYSPKHHVPATTPVSIVISTPKIKSAIRKPQPIKLRKQGESIRNRPTRNPFKEPEKKNQTAFSPFQPNHPKKYYTYPRKNKIDMTRRPWKNPIRLPRPGKDVKHTRTPTKTPVTIRHVNTLVPRRKHIYPSFPLTEIQPTNRTQIRKKTPFKPTNIPTQLRKKTSLIPSKSPAQIRKKTPFKPTKFPIQLQQKTSFKSTNIPTQPNKKTPFKPSKSPAQSTIRKSPFQLTQIPTQLRKKTPFQPTKIPTQLREKARFQPTKIPSRFREKTPSSTRMPTKHMAKPKSKQPENPRKFPRLRAPPRFDRLTPKPQKKYGLKTIHKPTKVIPRLPKPKTEYMQEPNQRITQRKTSPKPQSLKTIPTAAAPTTALAHPVTPPVMRKMPTMTPTTKLYLRTVSPRTMKTKEKPRKKGENPFGLRTIPPSDWSVKPLYMRLPSGHPCSSRLDQLVSHPTQCHWYYNCTAAALGKPGARDPASLEEECRYPQLFDITTARCREFINVKCQERFEPVDPCEYQAMQCQKGSCVPCHNRFGACRGRPNGIYPLHSSRWTPTFVTCYKQRNIAQDDCEAPSPIFSPLAHDCVSLSEVPKENGGLRPECGYRRDGFYPDEQGRCGIFFQCQNRNFIRYDECPLGTVFDPLTVRCQRLQLSTPPCGEGPAPSCSNRPDGFHADPFGRCPYYFECRQNEFIQHHTCDFGSFDPLSQECVIPAEQMPRPCGLLPTPCEEKPSGFYPDESSGCQRYYECFRGVLVTRASCPEGSLFSIVSRRCDRPDKAQQSCRSESSSCAGRQDGRYAASDKGCGFYVECRGGGVLGVKQCRVEEGGWLFNPRTGRCDFPHNVCPPCGYRWWGCARSAVRKVSRNSPRELSTNSTRT